VTSPVIVTSDRVVFLRTFKLLSTIRDSVSSSALRPRVETKFLNSSMMSVIWLIIPAKDEELEDSEDSVDSVL